jgi:excisionase family DNA binding protein
VVPAITAAVVLDGDPILLPDVAPGPAVQAAIDQVLRLVDDAADRLATRLDPAAATPRSLAELRAGPLGQDLRRLAMVADGHVREPRERVLAAIDAVLQLLFWPPGADDYTVPRTFWETDLGILLARAKYRAFAVSDLVGIGVAAQQLGVSRPTVYRWMDDGSLDYVRDVLTRRTFVLRRGVDQRRMVAAELSVPA